MKGIWRENFPRVSNGCQRAVWTGRGKLVNKGMGNQAMTQLWNHDKGYRSHIIKNGFNEIKGEGPEMTLTSY